MANEISELARREEGRVRVRPDPLRLRWVFDDLVTADGHAVRAQLTASVRALDQPAERKMLEEVFLSHSIVLIGDAVVAHFQSALRSAAEGVCRGKNAPDLLGDHGGPAIADAIKAAGKRIAFACGLEMLPPFDVELASPTLERQRMEAMQRELAEQRAAGQLEHFQKAAKLLQQFEELRKTSPQLSAGDVLKQINPADQGVLLQTLMLASGKQQATRHAWAVAGQSLLRIETHKSPMSAHALPVPASLGPLRSVQPAGDGKTLLVGARSGVMQLDPDKSGEEQAYADPLVTSQLGFSRVVLWNDGIWACHGDAGIVGWKRGHGAAPAFTLRPADIGGASPRNLQVLDETQLLFSSRNQLIALERAPAGQDGKMLAVPVKPDSPAEIVAILPEPSRVAVVLADGTVQVRDRRTLEVTACDKRCGPVSAAVLLPWLGGTRLLLATEDGPILCIGLDDGLVTQYLSPCRGLRALGATADVIVGLSSDRQRVILWHTWDPRQPAGDIYVPALTRHRAADVDV